MEPDTPERIYGQADERERAQVVGSSPGEQRAESSPLKRYGAGEAAEAVAAQLRTRFEYRAGAEAEGGNGLDEQMQKMRQQYPDFSDTLIRAVFKSNSFSLPLTMSRLDELRAKKSAKSWAMPSKKLGATARLPSLKPGRYGAEAVASPERSSKVTLERQTTSIFDRYSHVIQRGKVEAPAPVWSAPTKKRKLVRAEDLLAAKPEERVSLSDEEEDAISADGSADEASGDEYEERTPELDIDDQVLTFLNEADAGDIADLAETSIGKAAAVVAKRPFRSLEAFGAMDFEADDEVASTGENAKRGSRRRGPTKRDGAKMLDKIMQSMKGYNAIESLIKKCSSYRRLIADQIKKWGVEMGENESELNFMDTKGSPHGESDSESDTPTTASTELVPNGDGKKDGSADNASDGDYSDENDEDDEEFEDVYEEESDDDDFGKVTRRHPSGRGRGRPEKKNVKFFKRKPKLLAPDIELKDYQQTGLNWINLLYQHNLSCILADEMGLGKTCQVISFLAYLKEQNHTGPHLVVVPSSTLENWLREFKKFCPQLKIEPYYGSQQERAELRDILEENDGQYDAIVTTYNLASGNKADVSFLKNRQFNVVIYDEGHMLKNSMSERFTKLMKIHANFRLLLTGTPLQNNLRELMSLLEFIMPSLFVSKKDELAAVFKQRARTSDSNKDYNPLLAQEAIDRAKTIMKPFILRRRKDQVLKHLPAKHHHIEYCDMTPEQQAIYNREIRLVMEHRRMVRDGVLPTDAGERALVAQSTSKNLIMALRKAAIHPLLFRHHYSDDRIAEMSERILAEPEYADSGNRDYIREDMSYMCDLELHRLCCRFPSLASFQLSEPTWMASGKVHRLQPLLRAAIARREKTLVFSLFTQVLDILELVLSSLGIAFLRLDGSTPVNDRQALIDRFHTDTDVPVFLLSTKAGGFGINLVCANHVIIFDQSFNPHDDRQAADRAHRVGQTREVAVTTLVSRATVEEKILQLARHKLALDSSVSDRRADDLDHRLAALLEDIIYEEHT
ncbi:ACR286Cp [Eremothecium gossypii ATCC 10895]|uniref:DNA helicase n=1 Tax=Eremothecium gossypii (strain ATCC 10895 / CBS 109.51 / FGSC 9923 / NRRL Y-1056) TaxID=284811 RepID=Q75BI5_EREGS|nr:ACR286Cp [Eremothecium gossypii ATCC 10895]AAS51512.1 ACR286Cp [Eremothecium gossypii ATCC 10895]